VTEEDASDRRARELLAELVGAGGVLVLTGAGISTDSGIPDYRGEGAGRRRRTPITYDEFVGDPEARRRYWARSHVGWRLMTDATPNSAHRAVAALQRAGLVTGIVTQNVDGLHEAAGAADVVALHGDLDAVVCLECGARLDRRDHRDRLAAANPGFDEHLATAAPDGDAELPAAAVASFQVVGCPVCGELVPRERVLRSTALLAASRSLLVLGSSLTVLSGRRFIIQARREGKPIAIVNRGVTRADVDATVRIDGGLSQVLADLLGRLGLAPGQSGSPRRRTSAAGATQR
jgi:NAD-dependent SIR2 family protein deacetylase